MAKELHILKNFTIICNECGGKSIEKEDSRGYSDISGSWGELDLVCVDCGNREQIDPNED